VAEAQMIGRMVGLLTFLVVALSVVYGVGKLGAFGTVFAAFGGMLLGWSLQAPVSGFAAWILVSLKRPFRPGDRIQFPNLGLTGDVAETGPMYTYLNQVGGTIGSEEAVGRYILVPNAMLFSQVVINYTVLQESPYMLDEVVTRITYDSDWHEAERLVLEAAAEVTKDIIAATGVKPYVRADMYDYGVYLRLRYQTRVKDRAQIANAITKHIFVRFQESPRVDFAIPFIYSFRAALESREDKVRGGVHQVEVDRIHHTGVVDAADVDQVSRSITALGLLQPIVVTPGAHEGCYDVLTGGVRFEACKRLGWRTVPVLVQDVRADNGHHNRRGETG
jgi:small-conductance mechanosensitive channel